MEPAQNLYSQPATRFALPLYLRRERFWQVDEALQPAFLSREQTAEGKRGMLGYFYRERPPVR